MDVRHAARMREPVLYRYCLFFYDRHLTAFIVTGGCRPAAPTTQSPRGRLDVSVLLGFEQYVLVHIAANVSELAARSWTRERRQSICRVEVCRTRQVCIIYALANSPRLQVAAAQVRRRRVRPAASAGAGASLTRPPRPSARTERAGPSAKSSIPRTPSAKQWALQCVINGQRVWEGREVRIPEEPCLSCRCARGGLSCAKRACPVLPCPPSQQLLPPGECCPRCTPPTADKILPGHGLSKPCIMGKDFHAHMSQFSVDPCTDCTCVNGTAVCARHTCPVLTCGARALPPSPGKCCPQCPHVEEAKAACVVAGKTYQDGETWQMDACKSCECHSGEPRCAMERCPPASCSPDQTPRRQPGSCCPKCVDLDGICTVFGDPHYKTFDGKFYSFQGSCKYQLVSDCVNDTFSIRIANDARNTSHSSWTRTATLRVGSTKINLGRKMRVKVNGRRVSLPYEERGVAQVMRANGSVVVRADIGVQLLWDGDGFLEITVSSAYKAKLCGLCGNFNSLARDDTRTRDGRLVTDTWRFGSSWRVGGRRACTRTPERPAMARCRGAKNRRAKRLCREFDKSDVFAACEVKVNPQHYKAACVRDACGCSGVRCHCAAYRAYARECQRLGAEPRAWAAATWCEGPPPPWLGRAAKVMGRAHGRGAGFSELGALRPRPAPPGGVRSRPPPPILH
ncbi:hypothetical protein EVAR_18977_1 [Eumeta japonica]|uniref:BMP-binding endothelial regulator protein n=1 Tax=Eumeta variegata TaxID=151549 RepID=A0A4C1WVZ0_EUMVA|nr:hypothetical protein EVAR_18977_1 [Eumeta japonica]